MLVPANRTGPIQPKSSSLFLLTSPGHNSNICHSSINKIISTSYVLSESTILHTYLTFLGYPVRQRVSSSWQEAWSWWAHPRLESLFEASWQRGHVTIRQKSSVQATRLVLKSEQNCLKTALWRWGMKSFILHLSGRETPESRNTYIRRILLNFMLW